MKSYIHQMSPSCFFFFNDTATTEIYTLSLHDALPISLRPATPAPSVRYRRARPAGAGPRSRSEEHTSELQSQSNIVCRLLLEKKKKGEVRMTIAPAPWYDSSGVPYPKKGYFSLRFGVFFFKRGRHPPDSNLFPSTAPSS